MLVSFWINEGNKQLNSFLHLYHSGKNHAYFRLGIAISPQLFISEDHSNYDFYHRKYFSSSMNFPV